MEQLVKRIIWIDEKNNEIENKTFLEILKKGIKESEFYPVLSIKDAFDLIRNKTGTIKLKNGQERQNIKLFQYRLFYVIVSGSLSNEFFNEYVKVSNELPIISANIIFCKDEEKHKYNAYYLDDFLNPGKIYNEKNIEKLIEYINKNEREFLDDSNIFRNRRNYVPQRQNDGDCFYNASSLSEIALPYFFGQLINSTSINEHNLKNFQLFLLTYYPELKDYIFPSREKKIEIPYHLLTKFFLNMYRYEQFGFFQNMNIDLSNNKFDLYREYIYLIFDSLNKKSLKPYSKGNLYLGLRMSKEKLERLENIVMIQDQFNIYNKNSKNKDEINTCLYFSKIFLSFTKNIAIAKQNIIGGNNENIPVLFELEEPNDKENQQDDFFISNIDLALLPEFNKNEVLFLPFSCFEIVSIKDDYINQLKIKKIKLNYLNKYRKNLYKYINEIKDKQDIIERFLQKVLNSPFSNETVNLINFDIGKEISKLIIRKFNVKNDIINLNNLHFLNDNSKFLANTSLNNLFPDAPKYIQKILFGDKEALLIGLNARYDLVAITSVQVSKTTFILVQKDNEFIFIGERIDFSYFSYEHLSLEINESANRLGNGINNANSEKQQSNIELSGYLELFSVGYAIGDFIANYNEIKNQPLMVKLQSLGSSAASALIPFLPRILSNFLPQAVASKIPLVMASLSASEFILSVKDIINDKSSNKSETALLIFKEAARMLCQIGMAYAMGQLGFKLLMFVNISPGIISGIAAIGVGITAGYIINKIFNKKEHANNLVLYSESSYYQYIPKKFKEYCIPTLLWDGVSENTKSFAIELIEDGVRKWLVININKSIRQIDNENHLDIGQTIVNYQGISKHPYKVTFILYELKKEKFKPEDWGEGKGRINGYSEELSKNFIQVATLDLY